MSENDKSLRLLKVAKELNIGTATITEYLSGKGFQVENKPTAKITEDMYGVLLKEFQGDKIIKEEAKQIAIGKIRRDELHAGSGGLSGGQPGSFSGGQSGGNSGGLQGEFRSPRPTYNHDDESDEILIKNAGSNQTSPATGGGPSTGIGTGATANVGSTHNSRGTGHENGLGNSATASSNASGFHTADITNGSPSNGNASNGSATNGSESNGSDSKSGSSVGSASGVTKGSAITEASINGNGNSGSSLESKSKANAEDLETKIGSGGNQHANTDQQIQGNLRSGSLKAENSETSNKTSDAADIAEAKADGKAAGNGEGTIKGIEDEGEVAGFGVHQEKKEAKNNGNLTPGHENDKSGTGAVPNAKSLQGENASLGNSETNVSGSSAINKSGGTEINKSGNSEINKTGNSEISNSGSSETKKSQDQDKSVSDKTAQETTSNEKMGGSEQTLQASDGAPQLKIVGKINLDNLNPRGKRASDDSIAGGANRNGINQRKPENAPQTGHSASTGSGSGSANRTTSNQQNKPGENTNKNNSQNNSLRNSGPGGNTTGGNQNIGQKGTQRNNASSNAAKNGTGREAGVGESALSGSVENNKDKNLEIQNPDNALQAVIPVALSEGSPVVQGDIDEAGKLEDNANEKEKLNTNFQKLSGPSIIGKIELPAPRKSQPVASSSTPIDQARRKRKRKDAFPGSSGNNSGPGHAPHSTPGQTTGNIAPSNDPRRSENRPGGPVGQRAPFKKDDRPRTPHAEPTEKEIQDQIKATLARLSGAGKSGKFAQRAKFRRQKRDDNASTREEDMLDKEAQSKILKVTEFVTANELSKLMDVPVNQVISTCMSLGMFVSINQRLDAETLTIVAEEFGYKVDFVSAESEVLVEDDPDAPEDLLPRAPIVTVMGHVDHGKTSLLDYIRNANVIGGEAGGITQHIGAYEVKLENGKTITFLDTPGHEAFTAMRARGAQSTDIVIIVVAADDAVMPQTIEAINHAQAAGVPMVFAFNKMDKPGANPEKIREQLSQMNILVEEWGGKFQTQEISAKKGLNVDLLLEKVLLEAELLDLKANPNKRAVGTVVEAALDKGRGIVTTILVQAGTLRVGDPILAGCYSGRVKAMFNERQQKVLEAGPSAPVLVLGMQGAPQAGDKFLSMESEPEAREIANKRLQLQREQGIRTQKHITLDEIGRRLAIGNFKELNIIVKGDVDGSIEALSDSLLKLSSQEIQVNVLHKSVGQISESDVLLASASDAIIIGFQVRPSASARKLAEQEQIDIRLYSIIYDAINEIKSAMEGMLSPVFEEKIVCNVEIRNVFKISKVGTIAGCYVLDGKINRNTSVRIIRDGVVVHSGSLDSLKRFKDDVKEVAAGYECGLNIHNFNNIEEGDIIEGYEQVEVKRKLA